MRVEIIDDTHQRFNGINYHRHKKGYYINMYLRLHVEVWKFHNGDIPKGYEIHHIDQNKDNNQIENLQCLTRAEHVHLHMAIKRAQGLIAPEKPHFICARCGKSFTSTIPDAKYCATCRKALKPPKPKKIKPFKPPRYRTCVVCGKPFLLTKEKRRNDHRTCSPECHVKICGTPILEKICPICGKKFKPVNAVHKCCSVACGAKYNGLNRRGKSTGEKVEYVATKCELCGKEIRHRATEPRRFCSKKCLLKYMQSVRWRSR